MSRYSRHRIANATAGDTTYLLERITYLEGRLAREHKICRAFRGWRGDEAIHARENLVLQNRSLIAANDWLGKRNEDLMAFIEEWAENNV